MARKPYNPLDEEKFYPIPIRIMQNKKISAGAKLIAGYLLWCYGKDGLINPKISTLSDVIGYSRSQVQRFIKELIKYKIISKKKEKYSDSYKFLRPQEGSSVNCLKNQERSSVTPAERSSVTPAYNRTTALEERDYNNNVVVVLFEEYGWNFKNSTVELFSELDPKKYLDVLEYVHSKAKSNPEGFLVKILESGSNVPKYVPPKNPQVDVKAIVKKDEETKFKPTEIGLKYVEKRRKRKEQQRQREKQREALRLQSEQRTNEKIIQTTTFLENEYGGCNGAIQRC